MANYRFISYTKGVILTVTGVPQEVHPNTVRAALHQHPELAALNLRRVPRTITPTDIADSMESLTVSWEELQGYMERYYAPVSVNMEGWERQLLHKAANQAGLSLQRWARETLLAATRAQLAHKASGKSSSKSSGGEE